jgi:hypothetical protein
LQKKIKNPQKNDKIKRKLKEKKTEKKMGRKNKKGKKFKLKNGMKWAMNCSELETFCVELLLFGLLK